MKRKGIIMSEGLLLRLSLVVLGLLVLGPVLTQACTGIVIQAKDGSVIRARTMEFGFPMQSNVIVIPRNFELIGNDGQAAGLHWASRYAAVGANAAGRPCLVDGVNEAGLSGGIFYFPGCAVYPQPTPADEGQVLAPFDVITYVLTNCKSLDEVRDTLKKAKVMACVFEPLGGVPPCHYLFTDAAGKSLVVEYTATGLNFHDDAIGVFTNSPDFSWHMTNLDNYVGFSQTNAAPVTIAGVTLKPFGNGNGMRGLPGDFTPPSRFVRATAFLHTLLPVADHRQAVLQAFHLLNQFDIPQGCVMVSDGKQRVPEFTEWTSAADPVHKRFYIRTFENSRIRCVDLSKCDPTAKALITVKLDQPESIEDLTPAPSAPAAPAPAAAAR